VQAVKHQFCQRYIILIKALKARATGQQSMDHTCNMIQIIKTMKGIFWSVKKSGDMYIAKGEFADMYRLPDFDKMVAHPVLLVLQNIPVDEDAILPYFPNLVEAAPDEFNATPFVMAHNIPFHELQACVALHIWPHSIKISPDPLDEDAILPYFPNLVEAAPGEFNATPFVMAHNIPFHELQACVALHMCPHSIKISPDQADPYDIPNNKFCNSQILSQNGMSEPTKENNDASLLAMENRLFDRLMGVMQDQSQAMYAFVDRHVHHFSNSCDNAQPLYNSVTDSSSTPPRLN
jgi:hypothetical protein